ncbi:MAG TPA: class I SAM-dependent methyltransferase [Gammaproteobacteria bacterium]|nr:class I SAM-dependent methyltransferase [Gammaproteobacteria bacterium]
MTREFGAHVASEPASRLQKARKIAAILGARCSLRGTRVLDIGTGAGVIARYFAALGANVVTCDRQDYVTAGFEAPLLLTDGPDLPFESGAFEVAISNHVIEHVGERQAQERHLKEIGRVLSADGILYIAVPNRWTLMEPHYRLPLLSWLPATFASLYLRLFGKGDWYDCRPFSATELERLLKRLHFSVESATIEAFHYYLEHEASRPLRALLRRLPVPVIRSLSLVFPTHIFVCRK